MKYENDVFRFVESISPYVQQVAKQLGVSPGSIIGPIAHEYNARIDGPEPQIDNIDIDQFLGDKLGDLDHIDIVSGLNELPYDSAVDYNNFNYARKLIIKLENRILFDVGPGNYQVRTAVRMLNFYNNEFPDTDPLQLKQYNNDYGSMVDDLLDPNGKATVKFTGVHALKGQKFYEKLRV